MLCAVAQARESGSSPSAGVTMTMQFLSDAKAKFDAGKYAARHLPLLRSVYGEAVERIELRTPATSANGVPPSMLAAATMWIRDVPDFSQKLAANAERINKDLDSIARANRLVQVDRVAFEAGEARADLATDSIVLSMFYPAAAPSFGRGNAGQGPRFDADHFLQVYMPHVCSLWGDEVLRRVEATVGLDQGGQKAAHLGAYHLMVRDRAAYDAKARSVLGELQKDSEKFTNVFPMLTDLRVTAIG